MPWDADALAAKRIVYAPRAMDAVIVRPDVPYDPIDPAMRTMDMYYPPDARTDVARPAVVLVTGYSDAGARKLLGCRFKEMGSFRSWAQLMASAGLVAVTYANREPADVEILIEYLDRHAVPLGIDAGRLGVWACSGHGPNALTLLMNHPEGFRGAALLYPYTLDAGGFTDVAGASTQFRFVTVPSGRSVADLPARAPLFLARAGEDQMPGLNASFDRFVTNALAANRPFTVVNHSKAPHAFDLVDDSRDTRALIDQTVRFLTDRLA